MSQNEHDRSLADLRQQSLELIAGAVKVDYSTPQFDAAREALEEMWFELFDIYPVSILSFVQSHPNYFTGGAYSVDHLGSNDLKTYTPPREFTIAIKSIHEEIFLEGSGGMSPAEQLAMVEAYSQSTIQPRIPNAHAIMLPATVLAQADFEHNQKYKRSGAKLLLGVSTYTTDRAGVLTQVTLGRYQKADLLRINTHWTKGSPSLQAVYGVVIAPSA